MDSFNWLQVASQVASIVSATVTTLIAAVACMRWMRRRSEVQIPHRTSGDDPEQDCVAVCVDTSECESGPAVTLLPRMPPTNSDLLARRGHPGPDG